MKKIGFIGVGNMGGAIAASLVESGYVNPKNVYVNDKNQFVQDGIAKKLGVNTADNSQRIAEICDIIFIAVKPDQVSGVLDEIKHLTGRDKIIISIAAGISIQSIKDIVGNDKKVVRIMPNMPALVKEGMTAAAFEKPVERNEFEEVLGILKCFGRVEEMDERHINAVTAVTGSGPAYVFIFIEALADAAVLKGIPRDKAYTMAAQTVLGSAKMVLETGEHPGALKDRVCSPGGTTIEAVYSLEKSKFRGAVMKAVEKCAKKADVISCKTK